MNTRRVSFHAGYSFTRVLHAQEEQARRGRARGEPRSVLILLHLGVRCLWKGIVRGIRPQSGVDAVDDRLLDELITKELRKLLAQYSLETSAEKKDSRPCQPQLRQRCHGGGTAAPGGCPR